MKRIINGLLYDTDTAELIFRDVASMLYLTASGNWFVATPPDRIEPLGPTMLAGKRFDRGVRRKVTFDEPNPKVIRFMEDSVRPDMLKKYYGIEVKEA